MRLAQRSLLVRTGRELSVLLRPYGLVTLLALLASLLPWVTIGWRSMNPPVCSSIYLFNYDAAE